jgi:hypothetical protein
MEMFFAVTSRYRGGGVYDVHYVHFQVWLGDPIGDERPTYEVLKPRTYHFQTSSSPLGFPPR